MALSKLFSKTKNDKKTSPKEAIKSEVPVEPDKKESVKKKIVETEFFDKKSSIKRPWVSEKAYELHENNKYVFLVDGKATKNQVKKEIEEQWGVSVNSVNVINKKQRRRQWKGRPGRQYSLKKAIVTIKEGEKIDVYPV